jgi:hypothetical protein
MTITKVVEIVVRAGSAGEAELLLIAMRGGERERDPDGQLKRFGIPLGRDDAQLAECVRELARWVLDLATKEVEAERAAILKSVMKNR